MSKKRGLNKTVEKIRKKGIRKLTGVMTWNKHKSETFGYR